MKKLGLVTALGLALTGCGGTTHSTRRSSRVPLVVPVSRNLRLAQGEARFLSPTRLAIQTVGSSSCPSVPDRLVVLDRDAIRIHLVTGTRTQSGFVAHPPASGVCTADL